MQPTYPNNAQIVGSLDPQPPGSRRFKVAIVAVLLLILLLGGSLVIFINHKASQQAADLKAAQALWQKQHQVKPQGSDFDSLTANKATIGALAVNSLTVNGASINPVSSTNNAAGTGTSTTTILQGGSTPSQYVSKLGSLSGLSTAGNSGTGSTPTLSVLYGNTAGTAVQGNTGLICPNGIGNLNGGGNTINLGNGGSCNDIVLADSPVLAGTLNVQGAGGLTIGIPGTTTGNLNLSNSTSNRQVVLQGLNPSGSGNATIRLPSIAGGSTDTICLATLSNCTAIGAASGDLTGNYPGPTIAKLQGSTLTLSSPGAGQVLQYNGSAFVNGLITNSNLQGGTFGNVTGTGALTAGSIASGFGTIATGNNITTTALLQGGTVNATTALQLGGANINTAGTLSNVAYLNGTGPQTFTGNNKFTGTVLLQNASDSTAAFQVQNAAGTSNLLVADTTDSRIGVGTASPNTTLSVYNGNESLTQTDFTQALGKGGINIVTDFTDGAYTPGVFWSTQDNNATKPKAGIYMQEDGAAGTSLLFGTSGSYTTGITNTALTLGPKGNALFKNSADSTAGFQVQDSSGAGLLTVNTTLGVGSIGVSKLTIDTLGSATNNSYLCYNSSTQIASCSGGSGSAFLQGGNSFGATAVLGTNDSNSLTFKTNNVTQATIDVGGATTFKNSTDSASAFQVQGTGGQSLLTVDTLNGRTIILPPSSIGSGKGKLIVNSNWTDSSGDEAQILFGEGAAYGEVSSGKLYYTGQDNKVHLSGVNGSGATTDVLTFDRSGAGVILQSTNTLNLNSTGANNITIAPGGTSNTGVIVKPGTDSTTAFQIQNAGGQGLLIADTTNSRIGLGVVPVTTSGSGLLQVGASGSTTADQGISFGGDTSANLYRGAPGEVDTDGAINVNGAYIFISGPNSEVGIYRDGYIQPVNTSANDLAFNTAVYGESSGRLSVLTSGAMFWGGGSAPSDTNLYRSAAGTLKTDNSLVVGTNFTGNGTALLQNTADSTAAFRIQNAAGTATLLNADTTNLVVTVAGTTGTFGNLTLTNAHFKSTQTTAPTIGTPSNCGASPTSAVAASSTDSAGSFRVTAGTGGPTTCDTVISFNKSYGAAPKSIIAVAETKDGGTGTAAARQIYISTAAAGSFTVKFNSSPAASEVNWFYYWIIE